MTRTPFWTPLVVLAMTGLLALAPPVGATDGEDLSTAWGLTPEADRSHPAEITLAIPVFRDTTVTLCDVELYHSRVRIDTAAGEVELVALPQGGRMKVTLEIGQNGERIPVESDVVKVSRVGDHGWRRAWLGWVDRSGVAEVPEYTRSGSFPLELESGDVLLFSLRFTKKPKILGVDWSGAFLRRDNFNLSAWCDTCGSDGTPCPGS